MARRKKHEEHENHERWLVSYADFITLLFAFFVVMYAVSSVNEGKYRVLSDSLVAAFRAPAKSLHPIQVGKIAKSPYQDNLSIRSSPAVVRPPYMPAPRVATRGRGAGPDVDASPTRALETIAHEVVAALSPLIDAGVVSVRSSPDWVEVEINTEILFASGSAALAPDARQILERLAVVLRHFPNPVQVEGFTDDAPISSPAFPSNWELSAGRAATVVRLFAELEVEPERMTAIGFGQYRPAADNATAEGKAKNRRVLVVIRATGDAAQLAQSFMEAKNGVATVATDIPVPERDAPPPAGTGQVHPSPQVIAPPIHLPFPTRGLAPTPDA
ncbi:MAG: flagellar motor protein MotD [Pseudomonadales bacterium]|nr:flagellar motor protein MotD [Pseudomonadales bacterium]